MILPADGAPLVAVVIVNWNGLRDTLDCLASLVAVRHEHIMTIVADNGSSDDSVAAIRTAFPKITFIENGANLGFAGGNNRGIEAALSAGADFVLLLNNDALIGPDTISALLEAAHASPEAGIFGAKIFFAEAPERLWFAGARWMEAEQFFSHLGYGEPDSLDYSTIYDTDYASGCAMFVRAEVFRRIGLLDERFFLTYEETDFCYRARRAGYRCVLVPAARVRHKVSASFGGELTPLHNYFYTRNLLLWGERYLTRRDFMRLLKRTFTNVSGFAFAEVNLRAGARRLLWQIAGGVRRLRGRGTLPDQRARLLGFRDYLLRRFGDCPAEVRSLGRRN